MRHSVTSVFSEPDEFELAMRNEGVVSLATIAPGRFRATLTQVTLNSIRLAEVDESVPRIAFFRVASDRILVALSVGHGPGWLWNGQDVRGNELVTIGPGETAHVRTLGPIRWAAIWLWAEEFAHLRQTMLGAPVELPREVCCWRPSPVAIRYLRSLHQSAVKAVRGQPSRIGGIEAAHGLEQQLVQAATECLSAVPLSGVPASSCRPENLLPRLESLLAERTVDSADVKGVCAALGVSDRALRRCCAVQLGMSPQHYLRLRRMHAARAALREAAAGSRVAEVAKRFGFHNPGRFAGAYADLFGEQPSATLRHGPSPMQRQDGRHPR